MSHKEWRSFGFDNPLHVIGPDSSAVYYNALALSDVLLRMLFSVQIMVPVIEDGLTPALAANIMIQVDNFGGPEGNPPPAFNSNPHPLARLMPTLYPSTAIGVGNIELPVITRLWVGGTGREPVSVQGQRDANGAVGGRHIAFTSALAFPFTGTPPVTGEVEYWITWQASMLVERTP